MVMDVFKTEPSKYGGLNGLITLVVETAVTLILFLQNEICCLYSQMCAYITVCVFCCNTYMCIYNLNDLPHCDIKVCYVICIMVEEGKYVKKVCPCCRL